MKIDNSKLLEILTHLFRSIWNFSSNVQAVNGFFFFHYYIIVWKDDRNIMTIRIASRSEAIRHSYKINLIENKLELGTYRSRQLRLWIEASSSNRFARHISLARVTTDMILWISVVFEFSKMNLCILLRFPITKLCTFYKNWHLEKKNCWF